MAFEDQDEQVPFLSVPTAPSDDEVTTADENDYTTLKEVRKILSQAIKDLSKDFNTLKADDIQALQAQVLGRQTAYDILVPIEEMVKSAVQSIENQRKGTK